MKLLLLGGNGQVGRELRRSLAPLGELVVATRDGKDADVAADFDAPASLAAVIAQVAPDVVVNAAAYTAVDKAEGDIEAAFRALCARLACVKGFEWGTNSSPENLDNGFTHCFIVTFASASDRDIYLPHPDHLEFCKRYLDEHLEKACVVDFLAQD